MSGARPIRRTRQLRDDIISIYRHVRQQSPQGAELVFDAIQRSIRRLPDTPGIGRLWHSPEPALQGLPVTTVRPYRSYLIFFRDAPEGIEVFRVVHGARELGPLVDEIVADFDDDDVGGY